MTIAVDSVLRSVGGAACLLALVACSPITPTSIVSQPTTARATSSMAVAPNNGSIFQATSFRPMFEDARARAIGDVLTILISEKASADKNNLGTSNRKGSVDTVGGQLSVLPSSAGNKFFTFQGGGSSKYENKETGGASYNFVSTMTVTVIEVMPNGNLVVSGEKQIGLDQGTEFVRFSGVVPPTSIGPGNTVASAQVADARIEYRTNSQVDKAQLAGMMNRLFLSVLPF